MKPKFTYKYYHDMLSAAAKKYNFTTFDNVADNGIQSNQLMLRHDIDLSLDSAYQMAKIEHSLGLKATYFLRINSTYYNPFSHPGYPIVRKIMELGHSIGLHFDPAFYELTNMDVVDAIRLEMQTLGAYIGTEVIALSQHRPFLLGQVNLEDHPETFRAFTYNSIFLEDFKYISDSGQRWREGDLNGFLDNDKPMHVLVHPIWWTETGLPWEDCLKAAAAESCSYVNDKTEILLKRYKEYIERSNKEFGRK